MYKWQYASAVWLWQRGVSSVELVNEPDLKVQNACLNAASPGVVAAAAAHGVTPQQYVDMYWADWLAVRSVALQDAYSDANDDVAAGRRPCPVPGACPVQPSVLASAFSGGHVVTTPGILVGATVNNAYFRFPCAVNCAASANWQPGGRTSPTFPWGTATDGYTNFQVYSYHAYAKTGDSLFAQGNDSIYSSLTSGGNLHWRGVGGGQANAPARMPVAVTEFAQLTEADFAREGDSSDTWYMASRTGGQLVAFARMGQDIWHFKFSLMPMGVHAEEGAAASDHVNKHGIHFAENVEAPFQIGDQTTSGAVIALIAPYITDRRPLLSCVVSDSTTANVSLGCAVVLDGGVAHILLANDCTNSGRAEVGRSSACGDRMLEVPLRSLNPHASSFVVVSEVSLPADMCMNTSSTRGVTSFGTRPCEDAAFGGAFAPFSATTSRSGFFNEVSNLVAVAALPPSGLPYLLPAFGVARISVPLGPQALAVLAPVDDATVFAGANSHVSFGREPVLSVGTSGTAVHDRTAVSLLRFSTAGLAAPSLAVLELTVASAPEKANVILLLVGTAGRAWSEESVTWATADWLLSPPTRIISRIAHNFAHLGPAAGGGPGNEAVGHISLAAGDGGMLKRVDVTSFLRRAAAAKADSVTFSLVRRFRKNLLNPASAFGDVIAADDLGVSDDLVTGDVAFHSCDAKDTQLQPKLRLLTAQGEE